MEHVEVDDEEYARQRFWDVFQIGWSTSGSTGRTMSEKTAQAGVSYAEFPNCSYPSGVYEMLANIFTHRITHC